MSGSCVSAPSIFGAGTSLPLCPDLLCHQSQQYLHLFYYGAFPANRKVFLCRRLLSFDPLWHPLQQYRPLSDLPLRPASDRLPRGRQWYFSSGFAALWAVPLDLCPLQRYFIPAFADPDLLPLPANEAKRYYATLDKNLSDLPACDLWTPAQTDQSHHPDRTGYPFCLGPYTRAISVWSEKSNRDALHLCRSFCPFRACFQRHDILSGYSTG